MPILENWDGGFTYIRMYVHLYNLYVRKYVCINESLYTVCEYKTTMDFYKAVYNTIRTLIILIYAYTHVHVHSYIINLLDLRNLGKYIVHLHTCKSYCVPLKYITFEVVIDLITCTSCPPPCSCMEFLACNLLQTYHTN